MTEDPLPSHVQPCPLCQGSMHRSRATRFDQLIRKRFTNRRLFRCVECGWRGWTIPIERGVAVEPISAHALDLQALDEDND